MQTKMKFVWIGMVAALLAAPCFPQMQENKPEEQIKYFRLDFTVKELEGGKVVTSRTYSTSLSNQKNDNVSIRTGDKVPIVTGKDQVSYQDVGVNIDCNLLKLVENGVALHVNSSISSVVTDVQSKAPGESSGPGNPVIRNTSWGSTVLVPLKKAVTIFSSDGATTKRQTQLELTATPIP